MEDYGVSVLQALSIGSGWTFKENALIESNDQITSNSCGDYLVDPTIFEIQYSHTEPKKVYTYQNYMLSIVVKLHLLEDKSSAYQIYVYIVPCDRKQHLIEEHRCETISKVTKTIERLAAQYSSLNSWSSEKVNWLNQIWLEEKVKRNIKKIKIYKGTRFQHKPIKYVPIRIPKGWTVILQSFYNDYTFTAPDNISNKSVELEWNRDIAIFANLRQNSSVYVDIEDYTNPDHTVSLIHIHTYVLDTHDTTKSIELESSFCYDIEEAVMKIEEILWKYRNTDSSTV